MINFTQVFIEIPLCLIADIVHVPAVRRHIENQKNDIDSRDDHAQKLPGKAFAGGMSFPLPNGKGTAIAPNITSDKATGIGAYSDDDLKRVFDEGKGKTGRFLYTMPWSYYKGLTAEDKDALIVAIRAIPAVSQGVPPSEIK